MRCGNTGGKLEESPPRWTQGEGWAKGKLTKGIRIVNSFWKIVFVERRPKCQIF